MKKLSELLYVEMHGPDSHLDQIGRFTSFNPVNKLPLRCSLCGFPDIDFVPQPYLLSKGTETPTELASAEMGNFLTRTRARRMIETVTPGLCEFHRTYHMKSKQLTDWHLAVPLEKVRKFSITPLLPRCERCGEPIVAHGSHRVFDNPSPSLFDIFKSEEWLSAERTAEGLPPYDVVIRQIQTPRGPRPRVLPKLPDPLPPSPYPWTRRFFGRALFFSTRMAHLMRHLRIRGLVADLSRYPELDGADRQWVEEKIALVRNLPDDSEITSHALNSSSVWLQQFLNANSHVYPRTAGPGPGQIFHSALPDSYRQFIERVGRMTFKNVDDIEGFTVSILPPSEIDFSRYRKGAIARLDDESSAIDGIMFATTPFGDCFVFDIAADAPEHPVYCYRHELISFEPFTPDFPSCVRRFAGQ